MATSVQKIVTNGFGLSEKSRPELIASRETALVRCVERTLQTLFTFAARVNTPFFSTSADVSFGTGGWARPTDAESVFRIEGLGASTTPNTSGEILVIPYDDRLAFAGQPSVYRMGQRYYGAGNSGDPTGGSLRIFYARRPTALAVYTDNLDASWPEQFNGILEYEVAAFTARSDGGRDGELAEMVAERNRQILLFEAFLEHETAHETRRFGEIRWTATERREPLKALTQAAA